MAWVLLACGSSAEPSAPSSDDSGTVAIVRDAGPGTDAPIFTAPDARPDTHPLFDPCDPAAPSSCPSGFTCYAQHTPPTWADWDGGDVYGHCVIPDCTGGLGTPGNGGLCDQLLGTCACPDLLDGGYPRCLEDQDAEADGSTVLDPSALICVPLPHG